MKQNLKRRAPPGEHASDRYDPAQQLDVDGDGLWQRCASALPQRALLLLHLTLQLLGSGKCRIERLFLTWEEEKIRCSKPKTSSLLGAYEAWVGSHSGLARNVETTLYVAPQLVPRRKESADKDPPTGSHKHTRLVRVPLSLISHVQVLAEIVARRVG
ncbi:hypothetical protein PF008_g32430, partial [Phytophthora fragariae]